MRKVKITSDSISDLDYLFDQRGITRLPIPILLGDKEGLDGEITPDDIYKFFAETKTTPKTSARPIPTGNATASPAISIAATSKMFAILNTAPPTNADPSHCHCACEISAKKDLPAEPNEPAVKANASENSSTPIE